MVIMSKELHIYSCQIQHFLMLGGLSYGYRFCKVVAYSKAEALRIATQKTDNFKCGKVEQVLNAPDGSVHGDLEWIAG